MLINVLLIQLIKVHHSTSKYIYCVEHRLVISSMQNLHPHYGGSGFFGVVNSCYVSLIRYLDKQSVSSMNLVDYAQQIWPFIWRAYTLKWRLKIWITFYKCKCLNKKNPSMMNRARNKCLALKKMPSIEVAIVDKCSFDTTDKSTPQY